MLTTIMTALMPASAPAVDDDHALVRASLGGDTAAFEALYRRHVGRVHGVISRLLGRRGQHADDLTQDAFRSEEHTSELQSLMRISYAVFCLKKKKTPHT